MCIRDSGYAITGSDVEETKNTEAERALGVRVSIGHDAANVGNADLVVYSAAIHDDNPELQGRIKHYPQECSDVAVTGQCFQF